MPRKKLEKSKKVLRQYENIKFSISTQEELKYRWYLKLENILFSYLGVNKNLFRSIDDYGMFTRQIGLVSSDFSEEYIDNYIKESTKFLEKLSETINNISKDIKLDNYKKSCIYKDVNFSLSNYSEYFDNLELVSITFKPESRVYYSVDENEDYDMMWTLEDSKVFYKKVEGKFLKEDINFNMNMDYIESLEIKKNNEILSLTVSQFNKKYKDLQGFIYKELDSLLVNSENELISEAIRLISLFVNIRTLPPINFVDKLPGNCRNAIGVYHFDAVYILNKPTYKPKLEVLIHELGHYVHSEYFNNKQFRFSTKDKTRYAGRNCRENFAECFTDLIYYRKDNDRTRKMINILNKIV